MLGGYMDPDVRTKWPAGSSRGLFYVYYTDPAT